MSATTLTNQTMYETIDTTVTVIHIIQQGHRSQAYTRVHMASEDTNSYRTGPNVEVRSKIYIVVGAALIPISVFRQLCPAMFDSTGNVLEKFDS